MQQEKRSSKEKNARSLIAVGPCLHFWGGAIFGVAIPVTTKVVENESCTLDFSDGAVASHGHDVR